MTISRSYSPGTVCPSCDLRIAALAAALAEKWLFMNAMTFRPACEASFAAVANGASSAAEYR
ncbi:hypothetical protein D3C83_133720 [compost metagenome]